MNETPLESRIQTIGREIFARVDRSGPLPLSISWFDDHLMGLTMLEPALKLQLFRFIDTLPVLTDAESVAHHLREYLETAAPKLPVWMRWGIRLLPTSGMPSRVLAWTARRNAEHLARRFISGSNVQEALISLAAMRKKSLAFTIDLLGEATITEPEADAVQQQYLDLLEGLSGKVNSWPEIPLIDRDRHGPFPRVNVSVKLSALFSQFDPIDPVGTSLAVRRRLRPILREARKNFAFVNFDMEQYSFKDTTIRIFREILEEEEFRDWPHAGIAIQAYLKDTEQDLRQLRDWAKERGVPVWIRLVKGAYWDYETVKAAQNDWPVPTYLEKWQSDAAFERCARFLMENHQHLRPAFGTHNIRSISAAMALAEECHVPVGDYEFQMLYGMADAFGDVMKSLGQRVRIYTPYGQLLPGMAYLVRRLLENTSNESFLRASFRENLSEEVLLMNPILKARISPVEKAPENTEFPSFSNEPLLDFAIGKNREAMTSALSEVRQQIGRDYLPIIGGKPSAVTQWVESRNPSHHREVVGRCGSATPEQAKQAIAAARTAFPAWRDTEVIERARLLIRAASRIRARKLELCAWVIYESGKSWREADGDIAEAIDFCEYYARQMLELAKGVRVRLPGEDNLTIYDPRGLAVVIAPWNFPLAILCGMTAAALATGNTVIMKPAEQSSVIAAKLMEVFAEAGFPPGVVNYLPGIGEEIGPVLTDSPEVDLIAFTGSLGVGLKINETASKTPQGQDHVKRVIAEMGGKNAIIVDANADLDEAVRGVVESAFGYQGQKCSACSRVIVLEPIYDTFVHRLIEATKSLSIGPAEDPGFAMGPVIDAEARERILKMIDQGKSEAKLIYAGDAGSLTEMGQFVPPHIFAEVPESSSLAQQEIFGPVLSVLKANNLDDALRIANGTRFALTGGIFSRSPQTIEKVRRQFRVGNLYINRKITGALVQRQPFGGFRLSGIGSKAGGPDYLLQFVLPRTITENTMRRGFAIEE